ncbi:hypothetical protein DFH29DRAFT_1003197 [Suillus ampliporus]|nr:hypothetical protein DFH29DRAFT_1003197 [Suillus ampliporus]
MSIQDGGEILAVDIHDDSLADQVLSQPVGTYDPYYIGTLSQPFCPIASISKRVFHDLHQEVFGGALLRCFNMHPSVLAGERALSLHRKACAKYKKTVFAVSQKRKDRVRNAIAAKVLKDRTCPPCSAVVAAEIGDPRNTESIDLELPPEHPIIEEIAPLDHASESPMDVDLRDTTSTNMLTGPNLDIDSTSTMDIDHCISGELRALPGDGNMNLECIARSKLQRNTRLPKRYRVDGPVEHVVHNVETSTQDVVHEDTLAINDIPPARRVVRRVILLVTESICNVVGAFGLSRDYSQRPSYEPDIFIPSRLLVNKCPTLQPLPSIPPPPHPFPNMTVYRLLNWMSSGSTRKSEVEVLHLVHDVLLAEDFDVHDLQGFSMRKHLSLLDNTPDQNPLNGAAKFPEGWIETDVTIKVPSWKVDASGGHLFKVPGFHYRPLVSAIREAFSDAQAKAFHLWPFRRLWTDPNDGNMYRVYDELYTSDAWIQAHDDLQKQPKEPDCALEQVIAGLMFSSDATQLANFGNASAWPLYLFFGNLSKYAHAKPDSGACHLIGFLPSLPDRIKNTFRNLGVVTKSGIAALFAHCRRELFQGCWDILLDDEFIHAYHHGIIMRCTDGILRRMFPRIFTYSADYPEKVLIATIKDMGSCLCPRCLVTKSKSDCVGFLRDMRARIEGLRIYSLQTIQAARDFVYKSGYAVDGTAVGNLLFCESWVPTINVFAQKLGRFGFDPFRMLVIDFMHECELGTWKGLFSHLVRLLYALPNGTEVVIVMDLDSASLRAL